MKLLSMTCPNCNASLDNIDPSRKYCYCQYCGTKILIDNEAKKRETHIYDEARIKELEYAERARQDAILEKKRQSEITKKIFIAGGIMGAIAIPFWLISTITSNSTITIISEFFGFIAFALIAFGIKRIFPDEKE